MRVLFLDKIFFLWVCLLLVTTTSAVAQEGWPGAWQGDTDAFEYANGILNHRDDGQSGKATISIVYDAPSDGYVAWDFKTLFDMPPTSYNSFTFVLFSVQNEGELYRYQLEPSSSVRDIILYRVYYKKLSGAWVEVSRHALEVHTLNYIATAWSGLEVKVAYQMGVGLMIQSFTPHGTLQVSSEPIEVKDGTMIWEMSLESKFTSKKKLDYAYLVPRVSYNTDTSDNAPLKIEEMKIDNRGEVVLRLNKSVDTSKAKVMCEGFRPTLTSGSSPRVLIIQLGASFLCNREYVFEINHLINLQGGEESLRFSVKGKTQSESTTEIPNGIFITEVMADPPTSGLLKESRYIELYNNTGADVMLGGLILQYRSTKYMLPHYKWANGTFVILYPETDALPALSALLVPMSTFPALSGSFSLKLLDHEGRQYDEVNFSNRLYGEGYPHGQASIERIAYAPAQWRRSDYPSGGTPGMHTSMLPHKEVESRAIIINELMLSPSGTGEKFIELYNRSTQPIDVSHLYLTYVNKEEAITSKSWLLVNTPLELQPNAYLVLCPFPESLVKIYPSHDANAFFERIDFPAISPTYTEIELRSHKSNALIDKVIYRRQWLGENSSDRIGYSLERLSPDNDGTERTSWKRAKSITSDTQMGGTPGVRNSVFGTSPDQSTDGGYTLWPDSPEITDIEELYHLLRAFSNFAKLEIFTLDGSSLKEVQGEKILSELTKISQGKAPYPTMLMLVKVTFTNAEKEPSTITYGSIWLHHIKD